MVFYNSEWFFTKNFLQKRNLESSMQKPFFYSYKHETIWALKLYILHWPLILMDNLLFYIYIKNSDNLAVRFKESGECMSYWVRLEFRIFCRYKLSVIYCWNQIMGEPTISNLIFIDGLIKEAFTDSQIYNIFSILKSVWP